MARRSVFCAALLIIILPASSRQAVAELAFAGAGASQCDLINSNLLGAAPIKRCHSIRLQLGTRLHVRI
jgi:hypothetical protein